jgi:hypothetical protein
MEWFNNDHIFDDASNYASRSLDELPHVIWGLRTQVSSTTGFYPFEDRSIRGPVDGRSLV